MCKWTRSSLVQAMDYCLFCAKPLSQPKINYSQSLVWKTISISVLVVVVVVVMVMVVVVAVVVVVVVVVDAIRCVKQVVL